MVYAVDLKSIASACGFESHRRHLEIGLWPMRFLWLCRGLFPPVGFAAGPLVRRRLAAYYVGGAYKAETKGR